MTKYTASSGRPFRAKDGGSSRTPFRAKDGGSSRTTLSVLCAAISCNVNQENISTTRLIALHRVSCVRPFQENKKAHFF